MNPLSNISMSQFRVSPVRLDTVAQAQQKKVEEAERKQVEQTEQTAIQSGSIPQRPAAVYIPSVQSASASAEESRVGQVEAGTQQAYVTDMAVNVAENAEASGDAIELGAPDPVELAAGDTFGAKKPEPQAGEPVISKPEIDETDQSGGPQKTRMADRIGDAAEKPETATVEDLEPDATNDDTEIEDEPKTLDLLDIATRQAMANTPAPENNADRPAVRRPDADRPAVKQPDTVGVTELAAKKQEAAEVMENSIRRKEMASKIEENAERRNDATAKVIEDAAENKPKEVDDAATEAPKPEAVQPIGGGEQKPEAVEPVGTGNDEPQPEPVQPIGTGAEKPEAPQPVGTGAGEDRPEPVQPIGTGAGEDRPEPVQTIGMGQNKPEPVNTIGTGENKPEPVQTIGMGQNKSTEADKVADAGKKTGKAETDRNAVQKTTRTAKDEEAEKAEKAEKDKKAAKEEQAEKDKKAERTRKAEEVKKQRAAAAKKIKQDMQRLKAEILSTRNPQRAEQLSIELLQMNSKLRQANPGALVSLNFK